MLFFCFTGISEAQDVELYQQFNGQYDYLAFGNTLNTGENTGATPPTPCVILTSSSAQFELQPGQELIAAYLYWAGSGTGDLQVNFNGTQVTSERTFSDNLGPDLVYFAAFADVTSIIAASGNGTYTLSELDLTDVIADYCGNTTNFAGWAVTVIYEDATLPLNQVSIFDGLESVSSANNSLSIELNNLNVLDNVGARIGFTAWEGDQSLAVMEQLFINGNLISNPPLNPSDNAFNGTNSFTNQNNIYNMDIDTYSIENNINPGDTSALISLTSGQDFVMINNVITVLNSELPDATITIDNTVGGTLCGNRNITVEYTVYNINSTDELPANTPIAFYVNNTIIGQTQTTAIIPIGGQETGSINLTVPENLGPDFALRTAVDDNGNGTSTINEINEDNNEFSLDFHLLEFPNLNALEDLERCDAVGIELFNLNDALDQVDPSLIITFHLTQDDAINNINPILDPINFENTENPQTIYVRADNTECNITDSFTVEVIVCPIPDATIELADNLTACRGREFNFDYTVFNTLGTATLPPETPIAFYTEGMLIGQTITQNPIAIGGSEIGNITIEFNETTPDNFFIIAIVDDLGTGIGVVEELDETNNEFMSSVSFASIPAITNLPNLMECNIGYGSAIFDLTVQDNLISNNNEDIINYFTSPENAIANQFQIEIPAAYQSSGGIQTIYVRLDTEICFTLAQFMVITENCPPNIPQGISPNNDNLNDKFEITGLLNIFENFELKIYSREGNIIYEGKHEDGLWDAIPNTGIFYEENLVPVGTYFYVLFLNDEQYPDALTGWVYINY
ncbi:hypothetical protein ULMS_21870 [Patiriisocius marinistellae]|uniref:CARDB domain-containing protein n=1 Tax=Patiriisocius marinistellae TaxID=2494560 RepID=A0A5J4G1W9_9FLAO|nr:hypothetical protein ULMS_21870 [Patiriisocius marinistellae]